MMDSLSYGRYACRNIAPFLSSRAVTRTLIGGEGGEGCIFIDSCSARQISFQIDQFEFDLKRNSPACSRNSPACSWMFSYLLLLIDFATLS